MIEILDCTAHNGLGGGDARDMYRELGKEGLNKVESLIFAQILPSIQLSFSACKDAA